MVAARTRAVVGVAVVQAARLQDGDRGDLVAAERPGSRAVGHGLARAGINRDVALPALDLAGELELALASAAGDVTRRRVVGRPRRVEAQRLAVSAAGAARAAASVA